MLFLCTWIPLHFTLHVCAEFGVEAVAGIILGVSQSLVLSIESLFISINRLHLYEGDYFSTLILAQFIFILFFHKQTILHHQDPRKEIELQ